MTTTVIIKSPSPNHEDLLVNLIDITTGQPFQGYHLTDGDELTLYVHSGQGFSVQEVPKGVDYAHEFSYSIIRVSNPHPKTPILPEFTVHEE